MRKPKVKKVPGWKQRPDGAWVPDKRTWPKVRQIVAVAAAFILASCGGSGGPPPNTDHEGKFIGPPPSFVVYVQTVQAFPDSRLGEFRIDANGDGQVSILASIVLSPSLAARTIAHELAHAFGVSHMAGNCVVNPDLYQQPDLALCPAEVAVAAALPAALVVYVGLDPNLLARTHAAADAWNTAAGHVVADVQ